MDRIFILLCVSSLLCSCKQDSINPVNEAVARVSRLKFDHDNVNNIDFHYDALGRVTSINGYLGHSPANVPLADSLFQVYFTYTGSDQLPSAFHTRDFVISSNETHLIKYDANNNPVLDSIFCSYPTLSYQATTIFHHTPNWISFQRNGVTPTWSFADTLFRVNGNFISHRNEGEFDFDQGINPLNRLNISPIFYVVSEQYRPNWSFWSIWTLCNKNNFVRRKQYNYSSTTFRDTSHFSFIYNSQGLPQKRYWIEGFSGIWSTDTIDVIEYIYQ